MSARSPRIARARGARGAAAELRSAWAVVVEGCFEVSVCQRWAEGVLSARAAWTEAFDGEQFSVGRAFYTDYETDRTKAYFADAAASDARVEAHTPGLQGRLQSLLAEVTEGRVAQRQGWCGPGVHVFLAGGPVATRGGVVHRDTEGLAHNHRQQGRAALTLVAMLQRPDEGGDLDLWDVLDTGCDEASAEELARPSVVVPYVVGDLVVLDSYRLHRIRGFSGPRARISATLHAAEVDAGLWEYWF